jgi:hypothetical protein
MNDLETLDDFKLLQLAWVYDLNFPRTFEIVKERKYLEKIRQALPKDSRRVAEIYKHVQDYLERHSSPWFHYAASNVTARFLRLTLFPKSSATPQHSIVLLNMTTC